MSENSAVDVEFLESIVDGDADFQKELFVIFVENAERNVKKMEEALKAGDNNAWYMSSHAFKGAAASIGAFDLSKVLEYAQKHPEDSEKVKTEIVDKVREELGAVLEFIDSKLGK